MITNISEQPAATIFRVQVTCKESAGSIFIVEVIYIDPEDGGSRFRWNAGSHIPDYTVSQPRWSHSKYSIILRTYSSRVISFTSPRHILRKVTDAMNFPCREKNRMSVTHLHWTFLCQTYKVRAHSLHTTLSRSYLHHYTVAPFEWWSAGEGQCGNSISVVIK